MPSVLLQSVRSAPKFPSLCLKPNPFPLQGLLRCPPLHHGVWRQGLRGRRFRQAPRSASQVNEVR